jgi:hypothetical protein
VSLKKKLSPPFLDPREAVCRQHCINLRELD